MSPSGSSGVLGVGLRHGEGQKGQGHGDLGADIVAPWNLDVGLPFPHIGWEGTVNGNRWTTCRIWGSGSLGRLVQGQDG